MFVRCGLEYHLRTDLTVMSDIMESLFIEFDKEVINRNSNMIVGVLYRPLGTDINDFIEEFGKICSKVRTERKICYSTGDYNINLLNSENHVPTSEFFNKMYSFSLFPAITKPTRITSRSATLIDNIFCNTIFNKQSATGILYTDISDHFPIVYIDYSSNITISPKLLKNVFCHQRI